MGLLSVGGFLYLHVAIYKTNNVPCRTHPSFLQAHYLVRTAMLYWSNTQSSVLFVAITRSQRFRIELAQIIAADCIHIGMHREKMTNA